MRTAAKIAFYILTLSTLGFCVAFVLEEMFHRATGSAVAVQVEDVQLAAPSDSPAEGGALKSLLVERANDEGSFTDLLFNQSELEGGLMLGAVLGEMDSSELGEHFAELMARDLEDYRAVDYAGRVLQEIARREAEFGVALLGSLTAAEKEKLVPSVVRGWTARDPSSALSWIDAAWVQADGAYIDRELQNRMYADAMDELVTELRDYELAAATLSGLADPDLKRDLTELVARRIVRDGPEMALDRLAGASTGVFDESVMDAVAEQWAARDGVGAADWVLQNEEEMSSSGVRSIAKQLSLGAEDEVLVGFHSGLAEVQKRDAVASEVARLKARRDPVVSATWVREIERPEARRVAVYDALYEIGYEDFGSSVGYIDHVYEVSDEERAPVIFTTLKSWLAVDLDAVVGYLGSGRANLSASLSDELLLELEQLPQG